MPRLSIVVPVVGDPAQMEETLVSVLENRPAGCEVLVVLNQVYDDPYALAGEVEFVQAPARAGWVAAVNCGLAASRAPIVHVLPCGLEACDGWCEAALAGFADPKVAAVSPLLVDARNPRRVVSAGAVYARSGRVRPLHTAGTRRDLVADPRYAAAFFRKSVLDELGRFSPRFGNWLSVVDLGLALRAAGYDWILAAKCRMRAVRAQIDTQGALGRGWSAEQLRRRWAGHDTGLATQTVHVAVLAAGALARPWRLPEVIGRLAALAVGRRPGPSAGGAEPAAGQERLKPHFTVSGKTAREVSSAAS